MKMLSSSGFRVYLTVGLYALLVMLQGCLARRHHHVRRKNHRITSHAHKHDELHGSPSSLKRWLYCVVGLKGTQWLEKGYVSGKVSEQIER